MILRRFYITENANGAIPFPLSEEVLNMETKRIGGSLSPTRLAHAGTSSENANASVPRCKFRVTIVRTTGGGCF